jgi:hypothetical protein
MTAGRGRYGQGYNGDSGDDFEAAMRECVNHSEMIMGGVLHGYCTEGLVLRTGNTCQPKGRLSVVQGVLRLVLLASKANLCS